MRKGAYRFQVLKIDLASLVDTGHQLSFPLIHFLEP